jgi:hypothetical protein
MTQVGQQRERLARVFAAQLPVYGVRHLPQLSVTFGLDAGSSARAGGRSHPGKGSRLAVEINSSWRVGRLSRLCSRW